MDAVRLGDGVGSETLGGGPPILRGSDVGTGNRLLGALLAATPSLARAGTSEAPKLGPIPVTPSPGGEGDGGSSGGEGDGDGE